MGKEPEMAVTGRCRAVTKAGKPCKAAATGGGLCFFHANPAKAAELGRIGGRKNGSSISEEVKQLPKLDSVIAVRDALAQMIGDLHSKKLHPRTAAGLAQLSNALIRAMEEVELERRIKKLEDIAERLAQKVDKFPKP
jgi:hypothetical protein